MCSRAPDFREGAPTWQLSARSWSRVWTGRSAARQFASDTLRWVPMVREHDAVYAPFADVAQPVIDPADIAAVAAVCFTEAGHENRSYTLTGPESISPRTQLKHIGAALGRALTFHEVARHHARLRMIEQIAGELADAVPTCSGVSAGPAAARKVATSTPCRSA